MVYGEMGVHCGRWKEQVEQSPKNRQEQRGFDWPGRRRGEIVIRDEFGIAGD